MENENTLCYEEGQIKTWCEKNIFKEHWGRETIDSKTVKKYLRDPEAFTDEIYEYNLGHIFEIEDQMFNNMLQELGIEEDDTDEIRNIFNDYVQIDLNIESLIDQFPDILVCLKMYSNYDCYTSTDVITEPDCYLGDVFKRTRGACSKERLLWEAQQSYTTSILNFIFTMSVDEYLALRAKFEDPGTKFVVIPVGTTYGFHSIFQGACSPFESCTTKEVKIPIEEKESPKNNCLDLIPDLLTSYSIEDVYGGLGLITTGESPKFTK